MWEDTLSILMLGCVLGDGYLGWEVDILPNLVFLLTVPFQKGSGLAV